jgi:hypothetical protein
MRREAPNLSSFRLNPSLEKDLNEAEGNNNIKRDCRNCHCLRVCKLQTLVIHNLAQFYEMEGLPKADNQNTLKFKSPVNWYDLAWICQDFLATEKVQKPTNKQSEITQ